VTVLVRVVAKVTHARMHNTCRGIVDEGSVARDHPSPSGTALWEQR